MSDKEKEKNIHGNFGQTGYAKATETAAGAKTADNKETYFVPPPKNFDKWPENFPEFKEVMTEYHNEYTRICATLMGMIAEYLKEVDEVEDVSKSVQSATNLLRLAHYFAPTPSDDPDLIWAGAHYDLNLLTGLIESEVPGLQLKTAELTEDEMKRLNITEEELWAHVQIPRGHIIINTGEMLEMKTAGLMKARKHRVKNPGGDHIYSERFSTPFFASWSSNYRLKPFHSCVQRATRGMTPEQKAEYLKFYPDVTVEENLTSRLIEMNTIKNPSREQVQRLRSIGLLRQPTDDIKKQYPDLFV